MPIIKKSTHKLSQGFIDQYLNKLMHEHNVCVVGYAIINNHKIEYVNTISINDEIVVNENSLFQACSLSKILTALCVLILQDQKKVNIDKSINSHLNSWKVPTASYAEEVTLRQALNMTSGLCYQELNPNFLPYTLDMPVPTLKQILNGQLPATNYPICQGFKPGSHYHYSGAGYMVMQQLIEDVTRQSFEEVIQDNILTPLKMTNSFFKQPLPANLTSKAVPGFYADSLKLKNGWDNIPTLASGGLWSTPLDLALLTLALSNAYSGKSNSIFSQNIVIEAMKPQTNTNFGLGIVLDGENQTFNFRKNGNNRGYHNELIMFPNVGQGIVIMTNQSGGMELIKSFVAFVAHHFNWQPYASNFNEQNLMQSPKCHL